VELVVINRSQLAQGQGDAFLILWLTLYRIAKVPARLSIVVVASFEGSYFAVDSRDLARELSKQINADSPSSNDRSCATASEKLFSLSRTARQWMSGVCRDYDLDRQNRHG
jgi:hypothetical protein